jgi:hypothetical protein
MNSSHTKIHKKIQVHNSIRKDKPIASAICINRAMDKQALHSSSTLFAVMQTSLKIKKGTECRQCLMYSLMQQKKESQTHETA